MRYASACDLLERRSARPFAALVTYSELREEVDAEQVTSRSRDSSHRLAAPAGEGMPAPETMRRLNHAILDYQQGRLRDDATIVMMEWMQSHPRRALTAELD